MVSLLQFCSSRPLPLLRGRGLAFNPMGSLSGMAVAALIVLPNLISDKRDAAGEVIFHSLSEAEKANIRLHDLAVPNCMNTRDRTPRKCYLPHR